MLTSHRAVAVRPPTETELALISSVDPLFVKRGLASDPLREMTKSYARFGWGMEYYIQALTYSS